MVWLALVVSGLGGTALAFGLQTWAQRRVSASQTAVVLTLEPVFAAAFGYALAGDRLRSNSGRRLRFDPRRDARVDLPAAGEALVSEVSAARQRLIASLPRAGAVRKVKGGVSAGSRSSCEPWHVSGS